MKLSDALAAQGFAPRRVAYLGTHLRAMETLARNLWGATFTLAEDAQRSLDISPTWTPEAQFETDGECLRAILLERMRLRLAHKETVLCGERGVMRSVAEGKVGEKKDTCDAKTRSKSPRKSATKARKMRRAYCTLVLEASRLSWFLEVGLSMADRWKQERST